MPRSSPEGGGMGAAGIDWCIIISLGDNFDPNDEDLLDFLCNFRCFTTVTGGNISQLIHALARKVHYWLFCTNTLSVESIPPFLCLSKLTRLATNVSWKEANPKKIIKLLDANPQMEPERTVLKHFKRYIRSQDGQAISHFFSFLTYVENIGS